MTKGKKKSTIEKDETLDLLKKQDETLNELVEEINLACEHRRMSKKGG